MSDLIVVHSMLAGKQGPDIGKQRILDIVESAFGTDAQSSKDLVAFTSTKQEILDIITKIIQNNIPKIVINGGDGFTTLFADCFFAQRTELKREDYQPDILFLAGGTGNSISYCNNFKDSLDALKSFVADKYKTEPLNLLDVTIGGRTELAHFVSFGADGEILEIYRAQKKKGLWGYIWAVLRYSFGRKLYNIFSRNDANYNLDIEKDGTHIHKGRYEGGGVSSIPFVGYGFRPYPLAVGGNAHMRFVLFGAILMPTIFRFTRWTFLKRPNRIIYDHELDAPAVLDFSFDRELLVQVSGDLREKQSSVRVEYSKTKTLNMAKRDD